MIGNMQHWFGKENFADNILVTISLTQSIILPIIPCCRNANSKRSEFFPVEQHIAFATGHTSLNNAINEIPSLPMTTLCSFGWSSAMAILSNNTTNAISTTNDLITTPYDIIDQKRLCYRLSPLGN